jgi:hypothetical protein
LSREALQCAESDSEDGEDGDVDFQADSDDAATEEAPPKYAYLVRNFQEAMDMVSGASADRSETMQVDIDTVRLRQEMEQANEEVASAEPTAIPEDNDPAVMRTRVSILAELELNPPWQHHDPQLLQTPPPKFSQLSVISEHHSLNELQHKMFVLAGAALLRDFQSEEGCRPPRQDSEQFKGFLAGLPGAGKSQVIKALQDLAVSWERPNAVKTMAFQGVAAQAANGETIHKCFGWRLHGVDDNWRPNADQEQTFAAVKLIIIDEISTTYAKFIGQIDICLRKIRQRDAVLGGIHTLFVGDWLQQLPVEGKAAFERYPASRSLSSRRNPHENERGQQKSVACLQHVRGTIVYEQMTTVVILTENMRHRSDPTWAAILDRWRFGTYTQADIEVVNQTCHNRQWTLQSDG